MRVLPQSECNQVAAVGSRGSGLNILKDNYLRAPMSTLSNNMCYEQKGCVMNLGQVVMEGAKCTFHRADGKDCRRTI